MKCLLSGLVLALLLVPAVSGAAPPSRGPRPGQHDTTELRRPAEITLDQAVRRIQRQTGGRILSARTLRKNGKTVYRIKMLTREQRVRTYSVDAGDH